MTVRHPSVQHLVDLLEPNSNLPEHLVEISKRFANVRDDVLGAIREDNPEVFAGLRKLLEAKDCFVRAAHMVVQQGGEIITDVFHDRDSVPTKAQDYNSATAENVAADPDAPTA